MAWVYFQDLIFSREIAVMSDYIEKYPEIREQIERIFTTKSGKAQGFSRGMKANKRSAKALHINAESAML